MSQRRGLNALFIVLACLMAGTTANAQTANFDDLTAATDWRSPVGVPSGYAGKNWRHFGVFDENSGFGSHASSGSNYAYAFCCPATYTNPTITSTDGGTFDFFSAYVFTVQSTGYVFDVYGFDAGGQLMYSQSVATALAHTETFNFLGVTTVLFQNNYEANLGLDDMRFSGDVPVASTPEPASLALLGTGFLAIAGVARKRSRT